MPHEVKVGQVYECMDPRRRRTVKVVDTMDFYSYIEDVLTGRWTMVQNKRLRPKDAPFRQRDYVLTVDVSS